MTTPVEIRRILCPVDFSEFSGRALDRAIALARWYEAEITLLHVIAKPPVGTVYAYFPTPGPLEPSVHQRIEEDLRGLLAPAVAEGIPTRVSVREGDPVAGILAEAQSAGADLLLIGTHGRGGFDRWLLGSVAEKVLRKATCPVLTVPPHVGTAPPALFKRILCPLDFSPASTRALDYALSLAQEARARLTILHVLEVLPVEPRESAHFNVPEYRRHLKQDVQERLHQSVPEVARLWCEMDERVAEGKAYREILRVAQEDRADAIVMGVHGRNPLDRLLFGSTANQVVRQAVCPVVTVRAPEGR